MRERPGLRIVGTVELMRAPAPKLADYHDAPDAVTEELATYETLYDCVFEDRGHCRAGRVGGDAARGAKTRRTR